VYCTADLFARDLELQHERHGRTALEAEVADITSERGELRRLLDAWQSELDDVRAQLQDKQVWSQRCCLLELLCLNDIFDVMAGGYCYSFNCR